MNVPPLQCKICIRLPSLINAPRRIDAPYENYSKILGCSIKEQNHSIYSVSYLINKGLRIVSCQCQVRSKDRPTYDGNTITLSEDSA